mmetsp:Transcript_53500/g.141870  ORF Transcript_53500/g.141870 Transcript_53500/m.141870 type:complete len:251 (-) Transcript_53500:237-989(-)
MRKLFPSRTCLWLFRVMQDLCISPQCCAQKMTSATRFGERNWIVEKEFPLRCGDFSFSGRSVAGFGTSIMVSELGILFDVGCLPEGSEGIPNVLISHGHGDHIGSVFSHARIRRMLGAKLASYVLPRECHENFHALFTASCALDGDAGFASCLADITKSAPVDGSLPIGKSRFVTAHPTEHRVPSVAYLVWESKRVLLPEWKGRSPDEIRAAVKQGTSINAVEHVPLVGFSGDTTIAGVLRHPDLLRARR